MFHISGTPSDKKSRTFHTAIAKYSRNKQRAAEEVSLCVFDSNFVIIENDDKNYEIRTARR